LPLSQLESLKQNKNIARICFATFVYICIYFRGSQTTSVCVPLSRKIKDISHFMVF
jgi:hypothetical protein